MKYAGVKGGVVDRICDSRVERGRGVCGRKNKSDYQCCLTNVKRNHNKLEVLSRFVRKNYFLL